MGLIRGDFRGVARGIFRAMPGDFISHFAKESASLGEIFWGMSGGFL